MNRKKVYKKPRFIELGKLKSLTLKAGSFVDTDNKGNIVGTKPGKGWV